MYIVTVNRWNLLYDDDTSSLERNLYSEKQHWL